MRTKYFIPGLMLIVYCLIPITTILQRLFPFSINSLACGIAIVLSILVILFYGKHTLKKLLIAALFLTSYFLTLILTNSDFWSANTNGGFWWLMFGLVFYMLFDKNVLSTLSNTFSRLWKVYYSLMLIFTSVLLFSFFIPSTHEYIRGWEGTYFLSFSNTPHVMCSAIIAYSFVLCSLLLLKKIHFAHILIYLLYIFFVFQSGARTFLFTILFSTLFVVFAKWRKISFQQLLTIGAFSVAAVILLFNSSMMDKFLSRVVVNTSSNNDVLAAFTSGRTYFWFEKIKAFMGSEPVNIAFGGGFGSVNLIGLSYTSALIDAHNDFINIFVDNGMFGFVFYCVLLILFFAKNTNNLPTFSRIVLIVLYLFTAFMTRYLAYVSLFLSWIMISFINISKSKKGSEIIV